MISFSGVSERNGGGNMPVEFEIVAMRPSFGSVTSRRDGSVQVAIGDVVLRLTAADYWVLMELLSDAARRLAGTEPRMPQH